MKKVLMISLIFGLVLAIAPLAIAGKGGVPQHGFPRVICPPSDPVVTPGDTDDICFDWAWPADPECLSGDTPIKYSIDVELLLAGAGFEADDAVIWHLCFSSDEMSLCVPIVAFYYENELLAPVQFTGPARAKVKGLSKGKSQNNPFSGWTEFEVEVPEIIEP